MINSMQSSWAAVVKKSSHLNLIHVLPLEIVAQLLKPLEPEDWMHVKRTNKHNYRLLANVELLNQIMPFKAKTSSQWLTSLKLTCKVCQKLSSVCFDYMCYDCFDHHQSCWKCGDKQHQGDEYYERCRTIHCHNNHFVYCCDDWYYPY